MSHILAFLLWTLSSIGATDACDVVAVAADAEPAVCAAPPPPPAAEPDKKNAKLRYDKAPQRRISNGF